MRTFAIAVLLSVAGVCVGQQPVQIPASGSAPAAQHHATVIAGDGVELKAQPNGDVIAQVAPLKCGKYEHEEKTPAHCANTCSPEGTICTTQCIYVAATDACVPDLHTVTEKEWQELMAMLRKLEAPPPGCSEEHGVLSCLASPSAGSKEGRGK